MPPADPRAQASSPVDNAQSLKQRFLATRALTEGLSAQQADADFDKVLAGTVDSIYKASVAG